MNTVPMSKFRRELKKHLKYIEQTGNPVRITRRNASDLMCIHIDSSHSNYTFIGKPQP